MTNTTWTRKIITGFASTAVAVLAATVSAGSAGAAPGASASVGAATVSAAPVASASAARTGTHLPSSLTECSADFYDGDKRLGPARLPKLGLVGFELIGYHRTGSLSPTDFLAKYYDPTLYGGTGGWIYPPQSGYQLRHDGTPIEWQTTLTAGQAIDRYGSEYGAFLSPTGLPYVTRAIPPSNLDSTPPATCNYHNYQVVKPFTVDAGPIAAWFAQPGGGLQYQLDAALVPGAPAALNVLWLVDNGYLKRIS